MALKKEKIERTKYELRRQVFLGVFLFFILNIWAILDFTKYWLGVIVLLSILGVWMIMFARRGLWLPLWRALILLVAISTMTIGGPLFAFDLLVYFEAMTPQERAVLGFSTLGILLTGVVSYHFLWIIPHWRDTYKQNLVHKIKLDKATFSVTANWARRDAGSNNMGLWFPWVIVAGPMLFLMTKKMGVLSEGLILVALFIGFFGGVVFTLTELYNAYKMREIERNIGRPLIIDIYADK